MYGVVLQSNPSVGYRLAWNYLKAVRYVDALNVAFDVLATFPDYPKIQEDIITKAMSKLRGDSEREERRRIGLIPLDDAVAAA